MSNKVMNATYRILPDVREAISGLPARRRPSWPNTVAVCLLLADRCRDESLFCDETVGQVASTLCISENTARTVLDALHQVGMWVRLDKGNQHRGTRRRPLFYVEHRGANPSKPDGEHRGSDPAVLEPEHRGVDDGASWGSAPSIVGYGAQHSGADPTTPPTTTYNHQSSSRDDDEQVVYRHLRAHCDTKAHDQHAPMAVLRSQLPIALAVYREARDELGEDPAAALERMWPTGANEDEFDPGLWTHQEVV